MAMHRRKATFDSSNSLLAYAALVLLATVLFVQHSPTDRAVYTVGFSGTILGAFLLLLHGIGRSHPPAHERRKSPPPIAGVALPASIVVLVAAALYVHQNPTDRAFFSVGFPGVLLAALLVMFHWASKKRS